MNLNDQASPSTGASEMVDSLGNWTIGQLLRERFAKVPIRKRFRETPYLERVTLSEVLEGPFALHHFLEECRRHPQCGDTTIARLRGVIESAAAQTR
jgi:hypothetical protein